MKAFDYEHVKTYKFYRFIKKVGGFFLKLLIHIDYKDVENIPEEGGFILALNHTSNFDPFLTAIPSRMPNLYFMGKAELFESNPIIRWLLIHVNAFPVRRGKGDTAAIDFGIKVLEEGHVMAICPEGRRVKDKDGVPQKAKSGVAVIAKATGADILPCCIHCREGKIKFRTHVTVRYGKPITNQELGIVEGKTSELKAAANMVMERIRTMWEEEHCN